MKILISGAGVAGLTTAYWLKRYGHTPTLIEQAPSLAIGGYKIDIRGSALEILHKMNIYDKILANNTDMQTALLVDGKGKILSEMSGDAFGNRAGADLEIVRGKLCQILMEELEGIEFIFGDSIQAISQADNAVQVSFKKNTPREFDLVIGADGLHSKVRQLIFGEEKNFLHELGMYLCVFTLPNYLHLDRLEIQYSALGKVAFVWSARGDSTMHACFGFTYAETPIDLKDRGQQQQILRLKYNGIEWEIPKLLKLMPEASDFYFDAAAQIYMDHWSLSRVALVGDAAYCASPMSGQGTSLALIGAYILAGELSVAKGDFQTAFKQYEQEMRSFVEKNQELGIKAANLMKLQENHPFLFGLLSKLMRIMPGRLIKTLINRSTRRMTRVASSMQFTKNYD